MTPDKNINSKLENIKKNIPFKVPDNYFDTFQARMADRISQEESKKQVQPVFSIPKLRLVPVLSFVGLAIIIISSIILFLPKDTELTNTELAEIYQYQAIENIPESYLINELEKVANEMSIIDSISVNKDVYTDEAIEILSNESIDINTIINAL